VLVDLTRILYAYDSALGHTDVPPREGRFPRMLSHLTNEIASSGPANCQFCRNSCGDLYTGKNVDGWRAKGPFFWRDIPNAVGLRIPIGLIRDTLIRVPATGSPVDRAFARLQIRIDSVLLTDAMDLDERVDGFASPTAGIVTWTVSPDANGLLTPIFWNLTIGGC
jgi:hypothetical protein